VWCTPRFDGLQQSDEDLSRHIFGGLSLAEAIPSIAEDLRVVAVMQRRKGPGIKNPELRQIEL
jgi:hypothetical protein